MRQYAYHRVTTWLSFAVMTGACTGSAAAAQGSVDTLHITEPACRVDCLELHEATTWSSDIPLLSILRNGTPLAPVREGNRWRVRSPSGAVGAPISPIGVAAPLLVPGATEHAWVEDEGYHHVGADGIQFVNFTREIEHVDRAALGDGGLLFVGDLHGHDPHLLFHDRGTRRTHPVAPRAPVSFGGSAVVLGVGGGSSFWIADDSGTYAFEWRPGKDIVTLLILRPSNDLRVADITGFDDVVLLLFVHSDGSNSLAVAELTTGRMTALQRLPGRGYAALSGRYVARATPGEGVVVYEITLPGER